MAQVLHNILNALALASKKQLGGLLIIAALLAGSSTLNRGLQSDDYLHRFMLTEESSSFIEQVNGFFDFLGPSETLPWWTHPDLKISFWRPLSAFTHWLDYQLWPESPALMHLHSTAWYTLLVILCFLFFERFFKNQNYPDNPNLPNNHSLAFFAALLFCLDFSHFANLSWIANRNSLIASVFIVTTLIFYLDWKLSQNISHLFFSLIAFSAALLSAESGISVFIIICAYELIFRKNKILSFKHMPILVFLSIACLWFIFYQGKGFGSANNSMYFNPTNDIGHSLQLISEKVPVFLFGNFIGIEGFYNIFSYSGKILLSFLCLLVVLFLLGFDKALFKERYFQFLLLASTISLVPVSFVSVLDMRLGIYSSFFSAGLLALIFKSLYLNNKLGNSRSIILIILAASHLFVAILQWTSIGLRDWQQAPLSFSKLVNINNIYSNKNIFIFNYPSPIDAYYFPFNQRHTTNTIYVLNNNLADFQLYSPSANNITLNAEQGLVFIASDLIKAKKEGLPFTSGIYARAAFNGMLPKDFVFKEGSSFTKTKFIAKIVSLNEDNLINTLQFSFIEEGDENIFLIWDTHKKYFKEITIDNLLNNNESIVITN